MAVSDEGQTKLLVQPMDPDNFEPLVGFQMHPKHFTICSPTLERMMGANNT